VEWLVYLFATRKTPMFKDFSFLEVPKLTEGNESSDIKMAIFGTHICSFINSTYLIHKQKTRGCGLFDPEVFKS
jgi:hypothetical protein